jgi:GrpB-like predicted nucleotidyltransferase (UPF0157 family)
MVLGLPYGGVEVVEADPFWARVAGGLTIQLGTALDGLSAAIEHVGSTSVPGLAAKPIIDLAVRLAPDADVDQVINQLQQDELVYRGFRQNVGDWLFHRLDGRGGCVAIVHVVTYDDENWSRWLIVRDRLRRDTSARNRYQALKQRLAEEHPNDRESHSRGEDG